MCKFPFAYGGPSCKMNFSLPFDASLILENNFSLCHFSKKLGSLSGRLARIGRSVFGNNRVSL